MAYNYNPNGSNDELNEDDLDFVIGGVPYNVGVEYAMEHNNSSSNIGDGELSLENLDNVAFNPDFNRQYNEQAYRDISTGRGRR